MSSLCSSTLLEVLMVSPEVDMQHRLLTKATIRTTPASLITTDFKVLLKKDIYFK